ncbi:DUF1326 domain-containing protein [Cribrihabitans pelagius]|uniref:DUF1326 domain-containing protein n=1 Tax=Cribrihabitans pelagius TaxID=1765746 RepID=UPI003B5B8C9D
MTYAIVGDLLEVCSCTVLCPCWIGEDPDGGQCNGTIAYRINSGEVDGVDMSGGVIASTLLIPDNVLKGNWTRQLYVDSGATNEQRDAAIDLLQGKKGGGPLGDLAGLVAKELQAKSASITFELNKGRGILKVGGMLEAEMEPYRGPTGEVTKLNESIFTTIPGSPAYVSKAEYFQMKDEGVGVDVDLKKHNAIQGAFRFEHA